MARNVLGKVRCIRRPLSSPVSTCRIQLLVTPSAHPALDATLDNFRSVTFVPVAPGDVAGKKTVRRNSPLGFRARARTKPCALKRWSALGFAPLRSPSRHASVLLSSPGCTGRGKRLGIVAHCLAVPLFESGDRRHLLFGFRQELLRDAPMGGYKESARLEFQFSRGR